MNGTEQRNHRIVTEELGRTLTNVAENASARFAAIQSRIDGVDKVLRAQIHEERTHRLKLADEQRAYVDGAIASEKVFREANDEQLGATIAELRGRGFWSRMNWLFTGR